MCRVNLSPAQRWQLLLKQSWLQTIPEVSQRGGMRERKNQLKLKSSCDGAGPLEPSYQLLVHAAKAASAALSRGTR